VRRIGSDLDGVCPLRRQGHYSRKLRIGRRSARRRDLVPVRVEVPVLRAGEDDHKARPAMMMQVLALAGLNRDLKHPHLIILMQQAVVGRRRDQRLQMGRPVRLVGLGHAISLR
jgi:hypothetical protein